MAIARNGRLGWGASRVRDGGFSRPNSRWYVNGTLVLAAALLLFAYLCFIQASVIFSQGPQTLEEFQAKMLDGTAKAFALVLAAAVFAFFFTMQDYQMAFATLLERMMVSQGPSEGETAAPARDSTTPARSRRRDDLALLESSVEYMMRENIAYRDKIEEQRKLMNEGIPADMFQEQARFMTCMRTGECDRAQQIFADMMASDFVQAQQSADSLGYRVQFLAATLSNAVADFARRRGDQEIDVQMLQAMLSACATLGQLEAVAADAFSVMRESLDDARQAHARDKVDEIVAFLAENYDDPNLSVGGIANLFDMNASYLSRVFKKRMGTGLAEYLSNLRVSKAKELLRDPGTSVKDAAEAVGFNSVLTMNRAFKRVEGTTAGKVRELE